MRMNMYVYVRVCMYAYVIVRVLTYVRVIYASLVHVRMSVSKTCTCGYFCRTSAPRYVRKCLCSIERGVCVCVCACAWVKHKCVHA